MCRPPRRNLFWWAGALALTLGLSAGGASRAETVTFTATGRVTSALDGATAPVGTPYALTFTLDLRPPPVSGTALWVYVREYDLIGYTARLGGDEVGGTGRISIVHRPFGRDRVIVWGDDGGRLLRLAGPSASAFLTGPAAPPLVSLASLPSGSSSSFAADLTAPPSPPIGTFESSTGVAGRVDHLTVAPAQLSAVPLPSAAWGGLALLGVVGVTKLCRRRRRQNRTVAC